MYVRYPKRRRLPLLKKKKSLQGPGQGVHTCDPRVGGRGRRIIDSSRPVHIVTSRPGRMMTIVNLRPVTVT